MGKPDATRTGEPRNRLAIVGQQDRGVLRRPLQDRLVRRGR